MIPLQNYIMQYLCPISTYNLHLYLEIYVKKITGKCIMSMHIKTSLMTQNTISLKGRFLLWYMKCMPYATIEDIIERYLLKISEVITFCNGIINYGTLYLVWFICVLRHMQRYFSHIRDGTDVQADWRRRCTYGRAPNAIDILQGSLTCPSYTNTGPPFLYGESDTPPHLVAFYDTLGIRSTYSRLKPPASSLGGHSVRRPSRKYKKGYIYMYDDLCFFLWQNYFKSREITLSIYLFVMSTKALIFPQRADTAYGLGNGISIQ